MAGVLAHGFKGSLRGLTTFFGPRTVVAASTALPSRRSTDGVNCSHYSTSTARRPRLVDGLSGRRCQRAAGWERGFKTDIGVKDKVHEPPSFAFAFDIDGVLLHVAKPIPGAPEVLRFLKEYNIPFILLTNGGGKHETERVKDLTEKLGVELPLDNFVQSHTPFRGLLNGPDGLRDKTVLVTGSDYEKCRAIFQQYGFKNVVTPADLYAADPTIFPFKTVAESLSPSVPLALPLHTPSTTSPVQSTLKIDAMFVLNDPRDWALDIQIITDLLLSHAGHVGTYSRLNNDPSLPNCGWQQDGQPKLYFSNADLLWSAGYHLPRLGQGAFQAAVAGLWERITGGHQLQRTSIGKPHGETYRFAERTLGRHRHEMLREAGHAHEPIGTLKRVYMVGDNPESDIAGANGHVSEHGAEWVSVLVKTGVWSQERGGELEGLFKPRAVVDDVLGAVRWALEREGWKEGGLGGGRK